MKYIFCLIFLVLSCQPDNQEVQRNALANECGLTPDAGNCKALITSYYFDRASGKCKEFMWGGCGGVRPFESLDACQAQCEKSSD